VRRTLKHIVVPHPDFNPPGKPSKLTGRRSTLTGLFVTTLTPYLEPSDAEVDEALAVLGMSRGHCVCAYCGDRKTEWDHFRAVVEGRQPTGYITELHNLVPACGKCNQSRGNKPWREWMLSDAPHSPKSRGKPDIAARQAKLEAFLDYVAIAGQEEWRRHRENLEAVLGMLERAEELAATIRAKATSAAKASR
jgi:5-methylcytosine-specific restriction endonuclease McrA